MTLLWGNKSCGKSTLSMALIGQEQKKGKTALWIDAERTFDDVWARRHGVNTDDLLVSRAASVEKFANDSIQFMHSGIDIIVTDSITALLPSGYYSDTDELKLFEKTGAIGGVARDLSRAIPMISGTNEKTMIILISQQRNKIGQMFTSIEPTGGFAPRFYSSTIVKLWSSESDKQAIKGKVHAGDRIIEANIGRRVNWEVQNNKLAAQGATGSYDFYYLGDHVGVDAIGEIADLSETYGLITKSGAWYKIGDQAVQGRAGVVEYLREHTDIAERLIGEISDKSG